MLNNSLTGGGGSWRLDGLVLVVVLVVVFPIPRPTPVPHTHPHSVGRVSAKAPMSSIPLTRAGSSSKVRKSPSQVFCAIRRLRAFCADLTGSGHPHLGCPPFYLTDARWCRVVSTFFSRTILRARGYATNALLLNICNKTSPLRAQRTDRSASLLTHKLSLTNPLSSRWRARREKKDEILSEEV